jgi:hypothetical protein
MSVTLGRMLGAMAALEIVDGVDVSQLSPYRPARFGPGGAGAGGVEREEERGGGDERGGEGAKRSESAGGWGLGGGVGGVGGGGGAKSPHDFGGSGERGGELDLGKVADPASLQAKMFIPYDTTDTTPRSVWCTRLAKLRILAGETLHAKP